MPPSRKKIKKIKTDPVRYLTTPDLPRLDHSR
jgi:hypothetical protein